MCGRNRSIQGVREEGSEGSRDKFKTKDVAEEQIGKCYMRAEKRSRAVAIHNYGLKNLC